MTQVWACGCSSYPRFGKNYFYFCKEHDTAKYRKVFWSDDHLDVIEE